jgi:hypothetical protein
MSIFYNKTEDFFKKEILEGVERPGLLNEAYYEEMPTYEEAGSDFCYPDLNYGTKGGGNRKLNCQIVFGRDRSSHLLSGYGKSGGTPCAKIDLVAGRMSGANKKEGKLRKFIKTLTRDDVVGNNFALDASRIYISQKCDIDHYFGLPEGDFGRPTNEAGIGIKSDHVRVIGRESIKIFAGAGSYENTTPFGEKNSNGEKLRDPRIELIAGDPDSLQPMIRGENLVLFLEEIMNQISQLEQAFYLQNTNMLKLQSVLATHFHVGGGAGVVVVGPDPVLATVALSNVPLDLIKVAENVRKTLNFEVLKLNYLGIGAPNDNPKYKLKTRKNLLSKHVYTS